MQRDRRLNHSRRIGASAAKDHAGVIERLEARRLLAAHIVGSATVYATIQAAVNAAAPRAVINVDAGTYTEQVFINKPLTLRGARAGVDARGNVRTAGTGETILTGILLGGTFGRTNALYINASDVTVDGFTVQGNTNADTSIGAGIVIAPKMSGTHIFDNIVQNNVSGLFLANYSATDPAIIQHNLFRNNNNPGADGGRGIYTDEVISGGNVTNVIIDANAFQQNYGSVGTTRLEAAISFESRSPHSQSNIQVTNNVMDGNGKAVLFYNASKILIQGNTATYCRDFYSGVLRFEGGVTDVTIKYNTLYYNPGTAIRIDEKGFEGTNARFVITNNNIYGGDYVFGTHHGLIVGNGQYDGTLDATNNWWGTATGPSGDGAGTGDGVQANGNAVAFSPWATSPATSEQTPYMGLAASLDAPVQAENFDHGGEGVGDHNNSTTNAGGQYRLSANVGIEVSSDTGGGYDVGWTTPGEWLAYTVNASTAGLYKVNFRVANGQTTASSFHLQVDGQTVTGPISVAYTGGWQIWKTISTAGINLTAGQHVIRLVMDAAGSVGSIANFNWFQFINTGTPAVPAAPSGLRAVVASTTQINLSWVNNASNQAGFEVDRSIDGVNFAQVATVAGSTTTFSDSGLKPSTPYSYRVRATNGVGDSKNSPVATGTTLTPVNLGDLSWVSATSGFATVQKNTSIVGAPLTLRGTAYATGLGTHASSTIVYALNGQYLGFTSDVGIDDETAGNGAVDFQVIGDGKVLFDSGVVTGTSPVVHINVSLIGVQTLTLVVNPGIAGQFNFGHADWAGAMLTVA